MDKKITILVDFDHTLFDTSKFVKYMLSSPNTIDYEDFLYPDAQKFIEYASKFGDLTLFSEGEPEFQKEKIEGSGISGLFNGGVKIFPSYSKIQEMPGLFKGEKTILIDDKPEIIDGAISLGAKTIRVRQGKYSSEKTKNEPNFEVGSLTEIIDRNLLQSI